MKARFPYHVAFQIHVRYSKYTIKCAVVDEGDATCVMSLICWKVLGSPTLSKSLNMLTDFDSHSFRLHSILPAFLVQLGGNTVEVEVEVVDVPLDYNLLLGHNWTYAMTIFVSSVFCTLCFLHDGKIMMIDQLSFVYASPNASVGPLIPMINNSQATTKNIDVRMYSYLMGAFDFMALIHHVYAMSSRPISKERSISFHTYYFNDPWNLTSSNSSCEGQSHARMAMPLSTTEIVYQDVLDSSIDYDPVTSPTDEEDPFIKFFWATLLSCSHDFLDDTFPSNEAIIEAMNGSKKPWDDMHHRSYFLLELEIIEQDNFRSTLSDIVGHDIVPLDTHNIYSEVNMSSISPTIIIDISHTPGKIENVHIGANCLPEEILIYTKLFKEF
jgi:hypothetical protein